MGWDGPIAYLEEFTHQRAQVEFLPARPGDVPHSQADVTLATRLLAYKPQVDVKEGLQRTLAYYQRALKSETIEA